MTLSAQKVLDYFELIRLKYGLIALVLVYLAHTLPAGPQLLTPAFFFALLAAFLIVSAGSVLNNYVDVKLDLINNPERALPCDKVKRSHALYFTVSLLALATFFSALSGLKPLLISNLAIIALATYELFVKKKFHRLKVVFPGLFAALVVLFGAVLGPNPHRAAWLAILLFLAVTADVVVNELRKEVNKQERWVSLPKKVGREQTALLNVVVTSIFVAVSPIPYLTGALGSNYLLVMAVADLLLLYAAVKIITERHAVRESYKIERIGILFFLLAWMTALI